MRPLPCLVVGVLCLVNASGTADAAIASTTVATTKPVADLSAAIEAIRVKHDAPGLAGAIVELDGPSAAGVAGLRRVNGDPLAINDAMHLGSCTKSMTALLIGQLVDQDKVRFDETMADCFPALAAKMDPALKAVTVRQLLDHRSGLVKDINWAMIALSGGTPAEQRRRVVEQTLCTKPAGKPGEYLYSNVGYTLLGAIVDDRSGVAWETTIRKNLFDPLGMTTTGFGPPMGDAPWGHENVLGKLVPSPVDNPEVMNPAGRVHCSMADWSRYVALGLRAERADTPLIKSATYRALVTPVEGSDYAGGWMITQRPWAGGRTLTHAGTNGAWFCVAWVSPGRGFAVLAATNCRTDDSVKACDEVASMLIERHSKNEDTR
ncbi:MAG: serine hydrolase domain-containing protein [Tepidisphaeraceae bacterium]